jgi:Ca-activated chloride channel homolog
MRSAVVLVGLLCAGIAAGAAQPRPPMRFIAPEEGSYASDRVQLAVQFDQAEAHLVTSVTFFANGRQVCVAADVRRPQCEWDAGPEIREHAFRAVATLASGERRVATVRTKGLVVSESSSVQMVQVTAVVSDGRRFVKGLTKNQFRVYEDDAAQSIQFFGAEETPLDVVVALDVSGSMVDVVPELKASVREFVAVLRPKDTVTLLAFNDSVYTLAARDAGPDKRDAAINRLTAWGATALYDALTDAVGRLSRGNGRRVVVVFTDGDDSASSSTLAQAETIITSSDVTLFAIAFGRGPKRGELRRVLERLAVPSGGRVLAVDRVDRVREQFRDVVEELANQYLIGYQPPAGRPGEWRSIKVELLNAPGRVRARQGYRPTGG